MAAKQISLGFWSILSKEELRWFSWLKDADVELTRFSSSKNIGEDLFSSFTSVFFRRASFPGSPFPHSSKVDTINF